jgi:hypothetical protein
LSLEPACIADVRATYPVALELLHRFAFDTLSPTFPPPIAREQAILDEHTSEALTQWGRPPEKEKKRIERE